MGKKEIFAALLGYLSLGACGKQQPASLIGQPKPSITKDERARRKKKKKEAKKQRMKNRKKK